MKFAALCLLFLVSCVTVKRDRESARIEAVGAARSSNFGSVGKSDAQELYGMAAVFREEHQAYEFGARGATFDFGSSDPFDDDESTYIEAHLGLRYYPLERDFPLQPFLGLGLMWSDGSPDDDDHRDVVRPSNYPRDYYNDNEVDLWAVLIANAGIYAQVGLDLELGPMTLSGGLRAVCSDDVDLFARHDDDFAVELYFALAFAPDGFNR